MSISEFTGLLSTLPFPAAHYEFSKPTPAPCLVYLDGDGEHVHANSINVIDEYIPTVELYCKPNDNSSTELFEEFLKDNDISYTRTSEWISERKETVYIYTLDW